MWGKVDYYCFVWFQKLLLQICETKLMLKQLEKLVLYIKFWMIFLDIVFSQDFFITKKISANYKVRWKGMSIKIERHFIKNQFPFDEKINFSNSWSVSSRSDRSKKKNRAIFLTNFFLFRKKDNLILYQIRMMPNDFFLFIKIISLKYDIFVTLSNFYEFNIICQIFSISGSFGKKIFSICFVVVS